MNPRQIEYFVQVAEFGSFSEGAHKRPTPPTRLTCGSWPR
jgi:DNA-binding transcriptional LysR family regulator